MKNYKNKKKWVALATSLAAIAALAATFAWFTTTDSAKNHFEGDITGNDVEVVENFTPPTDWKPGQKVNKDVAVLNSGDYKSLIRVSFEELTKKLMNPDAVLSSDPAVLNGKTKDEVYLTPFKLDETSGAWTDAQVAPKTLVVDSGDYAGTYTLKAKEQQVTTAAGTTYRYASYWDNGTAQYYAKTGAYSRASDGTITPANTEFKYVDLTYNDVAKNWTDPVYKPAINILPDGTASVIANSDEKISLEFVNLSATPETNKWFYNDQDGYFYYVGIVDAQAQTAQLLSSVTLSSDADNAYSKVQFDLTVNAKSIQAAEEAVNSDEWLKDTNAALRTALEQLF